MKMKNYIWVSSLTLLSLATSCKKDDDDPTNPNPTPNESELITTIQLHFTDSANVQPDATFSFRDPDGDGGADPVQFDTIRLAANTTYFATILLLDESKSPADTISNEVADESADHMFFFAQNGVNIATTYTDTDVNGLPVGLSTRWVTGTASTGTSTVTLKHQPGVKDGTQAPGETDVEVLFRSEVQ